MSISINLLSLDETPRHKVALGTNGVQTFITCAESLHLIYKQPRLKLQAFHQRVGLLGWHSNKRHGLSVLDHLPWFFTTQLQLHKKIIQDLGLLSKIEILRQSSNPDAQLEYIHYSLYKQLGSTMSVLEGRAIPTHVTSLQNKHHTT